MYLFQREGPYLAEVDPAIALTRRRRRIAVAALARPARVSDADAAAARRVLPQLLLGADRRPRGRHRRARRLQPADADVRVPRATRIITGGGRGIAGRFPSPRGPATGSRTRSSRHRRASPTISIAQFGVRRRHIRVVHNPGRSRGDRDGRGRAARAGTRARCGHIRRSSRRAGWRMRRTIRCSSTRSRMLRRAVPARLFILGQGEREAALRRQIASARSRRCGGALRVSAQSLEVHRPRRRVRAELALRGVRQRAGRGDGVRRAGGRDGVARHARDRERRRRRAARRSARARRAGGGARTRAVGRGASGSACRRAQGPAPSGLRCRRLPRPTTACSERW